ncbi:MAG: formyltetrahydrofolate deformylase [Pseudomonadota bacterium]
MPSWTLTYHCPDVAGIQSAVSTFVFEAGGFIEETKAHSDPDAARYFARLSFRGANADGFDIDAFKEGFRDLADRFSMAWSLVDAGRRIPTIVAVSKFGHCLNDLLHRWKNGALPIDIRGIISNHDTMGEMAAWYGLPYHHVPITKQTKMEGEAAFYDLTKSYGAELVVLARYMQILSDGLAAKLSGRCINIHHSFLPSFKGAKPYHQAHQRGVKLIGATAHYVTANLDEGPIIEQDVERVDHSLSASELVEAGLDIEARVLSRAVKWHASNRVILNGDKTIVFN